MSESPVRRKAARSTSISRDLCSAVNVSNTDTTVKADSTVCGKCISVGYFSGDCTSETIKCYHYAEDHFALSARCRQNIFQFEVAQVMAKQRMQGRDAVEVVKRRYPDRVTSYASALSRINRASNTATVPRNIADGTGTGTGAVGRALEQRVEMDIEEQKLTIG